MSTIRERCQRRADLEGDQHVSTAEWNALISEKYGELYGLVCETGLRYFETTQTITATGADSYTEPTDHLATIGLDLVDADGTRRGLSELMISERNDYAGSTGEALYFTFVDDQLFLYPNPSSGTYELTYVPQSPDLSSYADADLVDLVTPDGEAMLIWGVAALARSKSESDVRLHLDREAAAAERLRFWAANRSLTEARHRTPWIADDPYAVAGDYRWRR